MTTGQLGDVISLSTFDGIEIFFDTSVLALISYGNWGAPPTTFITRRGYKQDGVNELSFQLDPREIPLEIWRAPACDRQTYWDNRAELLNWLRPNRNGPLTLTIRTPNGDLRSITVRANPGPGFPPAAQNNNFALDMPIEVIAFSPLWYDSAATVLVMSASAQTNLVFPITFPISFGTAFQQFSSGLITYTGTWVEYPIITLTGPYSSAIITNEATGVSIFMSVPIGAGEQRIIDLTPGAQSITDANGANRFSDLGPASNLVNFNLRPAPEVPGGVQTITITMPGGDANSAATLTYRQRYFGI